MNYKGMKIEYHILQSFPVTCLNRDDVGSPKSAIVGGVNRARVSSQAWKRQVRLAMQEFGVKLAVRTKYVANKIINFCKADNTSTEQVEETAQAIAEKLTKDTLHFFSDSEAEELALYAKEINFDKTVVDSKEVFKRHKKALGRSLANADGFDIALFGRMVAQAAVLNVEAASSFSHAISTHKSTAEVEFFTALDDEKPEEMEDAGSSHMGSLEFNSATYYRYISIDLGQLIDTLGDDEHLAKIIEAFTKALYIAVPYARQSTQAGYNLWDYAKVLVRRGQGIQASFENPVKSKGEGFLKPSIEHLNSFLESKEKLSGSLFGKVDEFTWGLDENFSIDDLVSGLQNAVKRV